MEIPQQIYKFIRLPEFFLMAIPNENVQATTINKNIHVQINNGTSEYELNGIIYFGQGHFITRMFDSESQWIYDGIVNPLPYKGDFRSELSTRAQSHTDSSKSQLDQLLSSPAQPSRQLSLHQLPATHPS